MHSQSLHFGSLLYMIMITLRLCFAASDYAISSFNLLINSFLLLDLLGDIELYDSIQCECDSLYLTVRLNLLFSPRASLQLPPFSSPFEFVHGSHAYVYLWNLDPVSVPSCEVAPAHHDKQYEER